MTPPDNNHTPQNRTSRCTMPRQRRVAPFRCRAVATAALALLLLGQTSTGPLVKRVSAAAAPGDVGAPQPSLDEQAETIGSLRGGRVRDLNVDITLIHDDSATLAQSQSSSSPVIEILSNVTAAGALLGIDDGTWRWSLVETNLVDGDDPYLRVVVPPTEPGVQQDDREDDGEDEDAGEDDEDETKDDRDEFMDAVEILPPKEHRWYRRPHPFYLSMQKACGAELSTLCGLRREFYQEMSCLETAREEGYLSENCAAAAFSGSGSGPNPTIFREVVRLPFLTAMAAVADAETTALEVLLADLGINAQQLEAVYGYVDAPLLFTSPEATSLIKVWFSFVPCIVQPAPKGILFQHNGGPSPHLTSIPMLPLTYYSSSDWKYILENYDIVTVDQRGMGMSSLDYLFPDYPLPTSPEDLFSIARYTSNHVGLLYNSFSNRTANETYTTPCFNLLGKLSTPTDVEPEDWYDIDEVRAYLTRRGDLIAKCSRQFDKDDGIGGSYNILQFLGTQGLVHDIEWLRWAFGSPKISLVGYSYGSRVAAGYAGQFPKQLTRMVVSGVMGPIPDTLDYAREAAQNTAEIFGFVHSQCNAADDDCAKNPLLPTDIALYEEGFYYEGNLDEAVFDLFARSSSNFYQQTCGLALPTHSLTTYLTSRLTNLIVRKGFQDEAWPVAMLELPSIIFLMLQNPCGFASLLKQTFRSSIISSMSTFHLLPALDMAGRWNAFQVAKVISDFAKDITMTPALTMFLLYARNAYGWPQLPTPISFSNPDVEVVIAQALYDQRTGMNMAQQFQVNFPRSNMVIAPVAGHCVFMDHGKEAWTLMNNFLLYGSEPLNGDMTDMPPKPLDFGTVSSTLLNEMRQARRR